MEEEKKNVEIEETEETTEAVSDARAGEEASEEAPKERRGLFGAKKRERNEGTVLMLYTVAAVYLFYSSFSTISDLVNGKVEAGRDTVISVIFAVIFAAAAAWILFTAWKIKKAMKEKEREEQERLAEEARENGEEPPAPPVKGGVLGAMFAKPQIEQPSVASRASVYYNPAEEEEAEGEEEESEGTEDATEETASGRE